MAWNNLGTLRRAQLQINEAINCYEKALDLNGNFSVALTNLLQTLQQANRFDVIDCVACRRR